MTPDRKPPRTWTIHADGVGGWQTWRKDQPPISSQYEEVRVIEAAPVAELLEELLRLKRRDGKWNTEAERKAAKERAWQRVEALLQSLRAHE